jgi:uncharacterized membrane protein YraQ (UPF0718 family)
MRDQFWLFWDIFQRTITFRILQAFAELFLLILPYFIGGVLFMSLVVKFYPELQKLRIMRRDDTVAIVAAAFFGVLSPLGTPVALPLGAALIGMGFSSPAVVAFIVASPLINPNLFFLTAGVLGLKLAVARTVSAWILGSVAGLLFRYLRNRGISLFPVREQRAVVDRKTRSYRHQIWAHVKFVGKYFLLAVLISAMVRVLVPSKWIADALGASASLSVLIAVAMGVPFYSCGGAAIPLMRVLVDMGMAGGPTLAFFISGPATKLSTIYVYQSVFSWKLLIFYLFITLSGAVVFGLLYGVL